jgi:hypothetical protein
MMPTNIPGAARQTNGYAQGTMPPRLAPGIIHALSALAHAPPTGDVCHAKLPFLATP